MKRALKSFVITALQPIAVFFVFLSCPGSKRHREAVRPPGPVVGAIVVRGAMKHDVSSPLASIGTRDIRAATPDCEDITCGKSPGASSDAPEAAREQKPDEPIPSPAPPPTLSPAGIAVEQTSQGMRPAAPLVESFDGLGAGFQGPQGTATFRNPSDNSLAVGPDHIVQIVNSRIAIYSKKGSKYGKTGTVLYLKPAHSDLSKAVKRRF